MTMISMIVKVVVFTVATLMSASFAVAKSETFMTAFEAQSKFGKMKFDSAKFKMADRKSRGEMAADLILAKEFIGKPIKSVREQLGTPDGYFENDAIPAYIISKDVTKKDTWQIVFLPDKDWKKIEEVKIHKNCCN